MNGFLVVVIKLPSIYIYQIIFISDIPFAISLNTLNCCSLQNVDICFLDTYVCFVNLFLDVAILITHLPFHFLNAKFNHYANKLQQTKTKHRKDCV